MGRGSVVIHGGTVTPSGRAGCVRMAGTRDGTGPETGVWAVDAAENDGLMADAARVLAGSAAGHATRSGSVTVWCASTPVCRTGAVFDVDGP